MSVAVKKLDGIESVEVSLEKALAVITLKPENKVTVPALRRTIRSSGYPTRDAQITARGKLVERGGTPVLDLLNGSEIEFASRPVYTGPPSVEITGVSREDDKKVERLTVTTIKYLSLALFRY